MSEKSIGLLPEHEPLLKAMGRARNAATTIHDMLVLIHQDPHDPEVVRQRIRQALKLCDVAVQDLDLEKA
jgi:ferredoxin-fold anticodon binding domain-containing protein